LKNPALRGGDLPTSLKGSMEASIRHAFQQGGAAAVSQLMKDINSQLAIPLAKSDLKHNRMIIKQNGNEITISDAQELSLSEARDFASQGVSVEDHPIYGSIRAFPPIHRFRL